MLPLDPMRPLVVLLWLVSAGIGIHIFLFVVLAATVNVDPVFWFLVNDSFEEFLGLVKRIVRDVASLNLVGTNDDS